LSIEFFTQTFYTAKLVGLKLVQARIEGLVFGAKDPKAGAICSRVNYKQMDWINHKFWVLGGVLEQECGSLLKSFFALKRKQTDRA
jgi:tRNA(adenine34) deaminase